MAYTITVLLKCKHYSLFIIPNVVSRVGVIDNERKRR